MVKAQIFSLDALIAVGIFVLIFTSVGWTWIVTKDRHNNIETRNDMEMVAENAISSLLETPGRPTTWNLNPNQTTPSSSSNCIPTGTYDCAAYGEKNISSIGLTKTIPNTLDEGKIKKLREINQTNYSLLKRFLGIQGPGYEFYLEFYQFNGTAYNLTYALGINKTITNRRIEDAVVKQRMALISNITGMNWALVRMELWR